MKILQINASYKPAYIYGGPIRSVSKLSEQLVKARHTIQVFTTTANGSTELNVPQASPMMIEDVPVSYFKRLTKDHSHFSPSLLRAVWKQARRFDVVHIHAWWNLVSVLSCLIAVLRGVPVVLSPRGTLSAYSFSNKNSFYKRCIHYLLGKPLLKRCFIHVTSAHEQSRLNHLINPRAMFLISNFIAFPKYYMAPEKDFTGKLKLLFLSRIEEKKGLDILLNALSMVTISYHLTIAGDGEASYINSLKQLIADKQLTENVSWIGFQNEYKFEVLSNHHLLVLPSFDENFGNVVIESLGVGTAVLISEQVGLASYVNQHHLGWVSPLTAAAFAENIQQLDVKKLKEINKNAPQIIAEHFNEDNLVQKYIAMYHKITHHD